MTDEEPDGNTGGTPRVVVRAILLLVTGVVAASSCCAGVLVGEGRTCARWCDEQREDLSKLLASDPAFAGVAVDGSCDGGWVILTGRVATTADRERLREQVTRVIGGKRAEYAASFVTVK